jgi:hypothetical protein
MKILSFLFLLALMACDNPDPPTINGHWCGTMHLGKRLIPIEFDMYQYGDNIGGYFLSGLGSGLIELTNDSRFISGRMVICADDPTFSMKYIFSGTFYGETVDGNFKLTIYKYTYEDFWNAYKK